jgi:hypothetical protein
MRNRLQTLLLPVVAIAAVSCATPMPDFGNQVTVTLEVPIQELVVSQGNFPGTCTDDYALALTMTFLVEDSTAGVRVGQGKIVARDVLLGRGPTTGICPFPMSRTMTNFAFDKVAGSPDAATFDAQANMHAGPYTTNIQFSFVGTVRPDSAYGKLTVTQTGTAGPNTTTSSKVTFDVVMQRVRGVIKWDGPYKT